MTLEVEYEGSWPPKAPAGDRVTFTGRLLEPGREMWVKKKGAVEGFLARTGKKSRDTHIKYTSLILQPIGEGSATTEEILSKLEAFHALCKFTPETGGPKGGRLVLWGSGTLAGDLRAADLGRVLPIAGVDQLQAGDELRVVTAGACPIVAGVEVVARAERGEAKTADGLTKAIRVDAGVAGRGDGDWTSKVFAAKEATGAGAPGTSGAGGGEGGASSGGGGGADSDVDDEEWD